MADRQDAKPVPEAARDKAWAASWLELARGAETSPEFSTFVSKLHHISITMSRLSLPTLMSGFKEFSKNLGLVEMVAHCALKFCS